MRKFWFVLIGCFIIAGGGMSVAFGQSNNNDLAAGKIFLGQSLHKKNIDALTGSLNYDSKLAFDNSYVVANDSSKNLEDAKKSVWLAAGMSAVIPGTGEFYSGSYIKSAIFIAIEAAAITAGLIYNKKGDNQTDFFQNYANQHWSASRYAHWTVDHAASINSGVDPTQYNVFNTNGSVNWHELNRLEIDLGSFYSHQLPYYGEQQYYELIGKYPQFYQGWDDADASLTTYTDIKAKLSDGTTRFMYYSDERGKANDYYNAAAKAVLIVVINHILSAIDAAWTAHNYNKGLEMKVSMEKYHDGFRQVYYPQLNLKYNF